MGTSNNFIININRRTGIDIDYVNEFISCKAVLNKYEDKDDSKKVDPKKVYEKMKEYYPHSFMKYTQRWKYKTAQKSERLGYLDRILYAFRRYKQRKECKVTRKNKRQVMYLDRIVDELNGMLEDPSKFSCERARTLTDRAYVLIYGKRYKKRKINTYQSKL